jgi:hypothetical protein
VLCWNRVASRAADREKLELALAAIADPAAAARLPADPGPAGELLRVARYHRLSPLLSAERGGALPAALAEACRRDRLITTARAMAFSEVAQECLAALAAAGIPGMVLKGIDYDARLYRGAGCRPTSDVDLLVPNPARRDAFRVLDRLGFEPRAAAPGFDDADYHEVAWTRAGTEVDLHLGLAPFARCRIDYDAVWRQAEPVRIGRVEARRLSPAHAAIFHALHMAIDHFAVPAIYLVDLARLLPAAPDRRAAESLASAWHCRRPLETAVALTSAFVAGWPAAAPPRSAAARRVAGHYGETAPLPRPEQLLRKLLHFDAPTDALRYVLVQSRRNARELVERRLGGRTARERLGLAG